MFIIIALIIIASASLLSLALFPPVFEKLQQWQVKKEKSVEKKMDQMFYYDKSPKDIVRLYFILPPVFALAGFIITQSLIAAAVGAFLGLFLPTFILRMRDLQRRSKFNNQLLDTIMILSSSLKGGLSLLQALEVVQEEMPSPMAQEVGLVVRENKMGISLEESLRHLDARMTLDELSLIINSILVARETGGDLTKVLAGSLPLPGITVNSKTTYAPSPSRGGSRE